MYRKLKFIKEYIVYRNKVVSVYLCIHNFKNESFSTNGSISTSEDTTAVYICEYEESESLEAVLRSISVFYTFGEKEERENRKSVAGSW